MHAGDARAGGARPRLRRAGGPLLPGSPRGARDHASTATTRSIASKGADGRVTRVVTKAGHELEADAVVMGTGAMPDVMLARAAGLELGETRRHRRRRPPADLGARDLRGRRRRRVRERRPRRPADANRALGRGLQPGQDRRAQHARSRPAPRRGALLLLRPLRLGVAGVRRPRSRMGPGGRPRLARGAGSSASSTCTRGASPARSRWAGPTTSSTLVGCCRREPPLAIVSTSWPICRPISLRSSAAKGRAQGLREPADHAIRAGIFAMVGSRHGHCGLV